MLASQSEMPSPMRSPPTAIASPPGGVRAGLSWEPWVMSDHSLMDTGDLERLLASPASPAGRPVYRKAAFGDAPGDECNGLISLEAVPCGGPPSAPPSAPSSYDNLSASPAAVEPSKGANGGADGAACAAERGHERRSRNLSSLLRSVSLAAASAAASTFGAEPVAEAARGSSHVSLGGAKKIKPAPGSAAGRGAAAPPPPPREGLSQSPARRRSPGATGGAGLCGRRGLSAVARTPPN
eukprot:CAMPEP_0196681022 /NCGR_PEP_ID=MMETSP1090-20130531/8192_1 /TAXON_ID=37098 /ORGANISM="Isochrysis sp, Strain CCMP1244" /LENGTH=238 /DNA_ID=CAMNT_0042019355 /DNA_START=1 /DNA_END=718 /DNA_ORIENTATION=+